MELSFSGLTVKKVADKTGLSTFMISSTAKKFREGKLTKNSLVLKERMRNNFPTDRIKAFIENYFMQHGNLSSS